MFNVAIDGPAGAGKSTAARLAAAKLGFIYVDTGALYRTVGVAAMKRDIATKDKEKVAAMLPDIKVNIAFAADGQHVYLDGEDVSAEIRYPEASMAASNVSAIPEVRAYLFDLQRDIAKNNDCIMDGRDIGSVILPGAPLKIFLTSSPEERARRRFEELKQKGTPVDYNELLQEIIQRDYNDSHREIAPLKPCEDSVYVDSSDMTLEQVVELICKLVSEKKVI